MVLMIGLAVSACETKDVKDTLGLSRTAPDEFRVVSRPPLSVPKEFYLTPPVAGGERGFGQSTETQAKQLVLGEKNGVMELSLERREASLAETAAPVVSSAPATSTGESQFLQRAGAEKADPQIREKIYQERAAYGEEEPGLIDRLRGEGSGDPVVNAQEEAQRIITNKEEGKPVNAGDVPVIDPKQKSTIERIFE